MAKEKFRIICYVYINYTLNVANFIYKNYKLEKRK